MRICVFCSANNNIAPEYFEKARELGEWMAREGHTLVFGGTNQGLMDCIARAVHDNGGTTVGVVPSVIEKGGRVSDAVDVKILCDSLSDRKDLLISHSDVFVALPGGVGTLDEVFTVVASSTIGYINKHVVLYNVGGFWDSLVALLSDLQQRGMIRGSVADRITVAASLDEVKAAMADV